MNTSKVHLILLTLIFLVFAYLRFDQLEMRIGFAWDQEQFSTQVRDIVRDHKLTLLGPRVTDDKGFFLAPYFTYILVPFYIATDLHPRALVSFLIVVNTLFFFVGYYVIKKIWSTAHALAFLALWTLNPFIIDYDTTPWWPVFIPLGTICVWYLTDQLLKKTTTTNALLLGLSLGFFTNMHFQAVFFGVFVFVSICIDHINRWKKAISPLFFIAIGFLVTFFPLFLFDARHDFLNTKLFFGFFGNNVATSEHVYEWHLVLTNTFFALTSIKASWSGIVFLCILMYPTWYLWKKHARSWYLATIIVFATTMIVFSLYGRRPSEYYFLYLYPFVIIILVDIFLVQKKQMLLALFVVLFGLTQVKDIRKSMQPDIGGLHYRDIAVQKILPYTKKPYAISLDMPVGTANGYRYLIEHYGMHMEGEPKAPLIQIRIPAKKGDIVVQEMGIAIPQELRTK